MANSVKKTILILSSSFGQGHMATARALESAAQNHPEHNIDVKIIDFSEEIGKLFNKTSKKCTRSIQNTYPLFINGCMSQQI